MEFDILLEVGDHASKKKLTFSMCGHTNR